MRKSHVLAILQKVYSLSWQLHQTAGQNAHFLHFLARWHPAPPLRHNSWRTNGERKQPHGTDHDRYRRQHRLRRRRRQLILGRHGNRSRVWLARRALPHLVGARGRQRARTVARRPMQAFERFFEWTSDRGIELWDHQEEALMDLAAGDHVILGTPTGSGKSLVALGMLLYGHGRRASAATTRPPSRLWSARSSSTWCRCSAAITWA